MREINVNMIQEAVAKLCIEANYFIGDDIKNSLYKCKSEEPYKIAESILDKIIINSEIAAKEEMPMCQDTGMACIFIEVGQDVHLVGGNIQDAINDGVKEGYD